MSALTPADITPGVVVTNGKGRFRMVTEVLERGTIAHFHPAYVNSWGKMASLAKVGGTALRCTFTSLLLWSTRLATPGERVDVIHCLNLKGIE